MPFSTTGRTILRFISAFFLLLLVNFMLPRLLPGDPLTTLYGTEAVAELSAQAQSALIKKLHLDLPLWRQFANYIHETAKFDLGFSAHHNKPVVDLVLSFAPWTVFLALTALTSTTLIGGLWGLKAAHGKNTTFDKWSRALLMLLNSLPPFVLALLLLRGFAISLNLLPLSGALSIIPPSNVFSLGADITRHATLPVAALVLHELPNLFLLVRGEGIRWMKKPFILVCRAKGLSERTICFRHLLICTVPVVLARSGKSIAALMGGTMFVEIVFAYPGLGLLIFDSLQQHDYPTVQGVLLVLGGFTLLCNMLVDLVTMTLQQRIRT